MNRLSLRNNRLKFWMVGGLWIALEESMVEYTYDWWTKPKRIWYVNSLDLERLGSQWIIPKNLSGHGSNGASPIEHVEVVGGGGFSMQSGGRAHDEMVEWERESSPSLSRSNELQHWRGKWLLAQFEFPKHIALILCLISYEKWM